MNRSSPPRRRRRTAADDAAGAATRERDSSPWSSLHEDMVSQIAWRVLAAGDVLDYIRFRAVCANWWSSTSSPRGRGIVDRRFHPRRWMMLPEGHGLHPGHGKLRGFIRFFNLSTGAFVRVQLPLFKDHCVLDSIDGILLLQRDHDTAIRLLHPFTGDILDFPPLETLLRYVNPELLGNKWHYIRSISAASINVSEDEIVSLIILGSPGMLQAAYANSGDLQRRVSSWYLKQIFSPLSFQGKLYVVRDCGGFTGPEVILIDPPELHGTEPWVPPPRSIAKCPVSAQNEPGLYYLVEWGSEILVVATRIGFRHSKLSVHRLSDLVLGKNSVLMTCIDGDALFIGLRNLCVSSKVFPTIVGDTIVFYHAKEYYVAQYHLGSGAFLPASDVSISGFAIPSPCSIIYHIYTCCYRQQWNKGQIRFQGEMKEWRVKRKWRIGA